MFTMTTVYVAGLTLAVFSQAVSEVDCLLQPSNHVRLMRSIDEDVGEDILGEAEAQVEAKAEAEAKAEDIPGEVANSMQSQESRTSEILPPNCLSLITDDDPYWSLSERLGVSATKCARRPYTAFCSTNFTTRERVSSLRGLVRSTVGLFLSHNVTYTVAHGTGIGAWRCADVLPWDGDADMLVEDGDMPKLLGLLSETLDAKFNGVRSFDMASVGFEGFALMQKEVSTGAIPLVVVDLSTSMYVDIFPAKAMPDGGVYAPWPFALEQNRVKCNSAELFHGMSRSSYWCYNYTRAYLWPAKPCRIANIDVMCPNNNVRHLLESYPTVTHPDIDTRGVMPATPEDLTENGDLKE